MVPCGYAVVGSVKVIIKMRFPKLPEHSLAAYSIFSALVMMSVNFSAVTCSMVSGNGFH